MFTVKTLGASGRVCNLKRDGRGLLPGLDRAIVEGMATYLYETTDSSKPVQRFEIQQGMKEAALTRHPQTGEAIRRVITGGLGYMAKAGEPTGKPGQSPGSCGVGCGCH